MAEIGYLSVRLAADASAYYQELQSASDRSSSWAGDITKKIGGGIAAGIAAGGAAFAAGVSLIGKSAFDMAGQMQEATAAIIRGTGASGETLSEMNGIVKTLAGSSQGLGQELGTLGAVVAEVNTRTGATGESLQTFSGNILDITRMMGGDAVANTQKITRVMGDWGVSVEDSAALMDRLHGAGQAFGIGIDSISGKLVQFGAPLRQMGFSLDESIALFGKWEKEGVNTELAIGSLRIAAGQFARDNIPLRDGLNATMEAIKGASSESEALNIAMETFGARAGPDMAAAIREGRFELDGAIEALNGTTGGLEDAAKRSMTFAERWQLMKNRVMVSLLPIGQGLMGLAEKVMPYVEQGLTSLSSFFEGFGERAFDDMNGVIGIGGDLLKAIEWMFTGKGGEVDWWQDITGAISWLVTGEGSEAGGWADTTASALSSMGDAVSRIVDFFQPFVTYIGELITDWVSWKDVLIVAGAAVAAVVLPALWALIAAVAPVIALFAGAVAVVALLRNAWETDFGGIRDFVAGIWDAIKQGFQAFKDLFAGDFDGFLENISGAWDTAWTAITEFVGNLWEMVSPHLSAFWESTVSWFDGIDWVSLGQTVVDFVVEGLQTIVDLVMPVLANFLTAVNDWFASIDWVQLGLDVTNAVMDGIEYLITDIIPTLQSWWQEIVNWFYDTDWGGLGSDAAQAIIDGIRNLAGNVASAMTGIVQGGIDAIKARFGYQSPPKYFREEIGEMGGVAIALGFEDATPAVEAAFAGIFQGLTAPTINGNIPEVAGVAAPRGGNDITFNINNNDPLTTAELIQQRLEGIS